jgi:hypothetical protein
MGTAACVHHPRRVELRCASREEALRRCELALRMRFANVFHTDRDRNGLGTDDRYGGAARVTRCRAFVSLVPGEWGWAAEVTVLREELRGGDSPGWPAHPRWRFAGRDAELESFLAEELSALPASSPFARGA